MPSARVEWAPAALEQAERINAWWLANRPLAPGLFTDELAAAIEKLAGSPLMGTRYRKATDCSFSGPLRRILLQRTGDHVYYLVSERHPTVCVHAIWHAARGNGPPL